MWGNILSILYLFVALASAIPANYDSGDSAEDGLVYVFNLYAVRNTKTQHVAKMLNDETLVKVPVNFEPIGSMLLADDEDEPFTMKEVSQFLEGVGVTVEQLNDDDEPRVIEIKFDDSFEDFDLWMMDWDETVKFLQDEGIIVSVTIVNGSTVFSVELDETRENMDRRFTLRGIGEVFEMEGYQVEYVTAGDSIKSIKIREPSDDDESKQTVEPSTTKSSIEVKPERNPNKIEMNDEKLKSRKNELDEQFQMLGFTTKSESLNKIRRRRSALPEYKALEIMKSYVHEHEAH